MGFFLGFGCVAVPEGLISRVRLASYSPQRMNVAVGHKAHVFASHVHFCGSYPDGGTLGYQAHRHGPTPKAEKEPKGSGKSKSVRSDAAAGYYTDFLKPAEKHETVDNSCF